MLARLYSVFFYLGYNVKLNILEVMNFFDQPIKFTALARFAVVLIVQLLLKHGDLVVCKNASVIGKTHCAIFQRISSQRWVFEAVDVAAGRRLGKVNIIVIVIVIVIVSEVLLKNLNVTALLVVKGVGIVSSKFLK